MNATNAGFANRCLPMRIASQAGWVVVNERPLRAKWLGGLEPGGIVVESLGTSEPCAISHFGEGILTFPLPFLFRTPSTVQLQIRGPANSLKDAIAPLEAIVETDWSVAGTSMNWKFTRPDTWVEFLQDEPIGMVVPQQLELLENALPVIINMDEDQELSGKFEVWRQSMRDFNERLHNREPVAIRRGWQRYYLRGGAPHAGNDVIAGPGVHRTKLLVRDFAPCPRDHLSQPDLLQPKDR